MKRNVLLDFLRFCGIILVMFNHMAITGSSYAEQFFKLLKTGGWIGVDLFFVLSGYLVSGLIMKEYQMHGSFDYKRFLIRRGFKIYPAYYFLLLCSFLSVRFKHSGNLQLPAKFFHEAIFITNYASHYKDDDYLWSISVEEHFYILLAILFFIAIKYGRFSLKNILVTYGVVAVVGFSFRLYNYLHFSDYNFDRDYTGSHIRFDALFFGVLLCYLQLFHRAMVNRFLQRKTTVWLVIACGLFILSNFIFDREHHRWISLINLLLNPVCFGIIMLWLLNIESRQLDKVMVPFAVIGKYSYSIYLFHFLINNTCFHFFQHQKWLYYAAYFSLSVIIGTCISKVIEYPLIALRDRYFASRAKPVIKPVLI